MDIVNLIETIVHQQVKDALEEMNVEAVVRDVLYQDSPDIEYSIRSSIERKVNDVIESMDLDELVEEELEDMYF